MWQIHSTQRLVFQISRGFFPKTFCHTYPTSYPTQLVHSFTKLKLYIYFVSRFFPPYICIDPKLRSSLLLSFPHLVLSVFPILLLTQIQIFKYEPCTGHIRENNKGKSHLPQGKKNTNQHRCVLTPNHHRYHRLSILLDFVLLREPSPCM